MSDCEHRCGNSTYRALGRSYNTPSWIKWMREHGLPVDQVATDPGWVVRNVADKQVVVLVYDWNDGDDVRPGTSGGPTRWYPDRAGDGKDCRMRAFVSQLDYEPAPFPTSSDCGSEVRELAFGCRTETDYEHSARMS